MTALRTTHDVTTVSQAAVNGTHLTVTDIQAFAVECAAENIPGDTVIGIRHDPHTQRWMLIEAVHSTLVANWDEPDDTNPSEDLGGLALPGDPPQDDESAEASGHDSV